MCYKKNVNINHFWILILCILYCNSGECLNKTSKIPQDTSLVCGQKPTTNITNVNGRQTAKQGGYPWHVGIYLNNESKTYICGGSILSKRVIVTAAHCVTDAEGNLEPKKNYLIAAGKHYSLYEENKDTTAQSALIKEMYVPKTYKGALTNYQSDIAVLVLKSSLTFSIAVQPVCVDWNNNFEFEQLDSNNRGVLAGWSLNPNSDYKLYLELQELSLPVIPFEDCFDNVPKSFRRFLTFDKMCAGFLSKGISIGQGDGGGGLTFLRKGDNRYYIRGIASVSPRNEEQHGESDQYGAYTLISKYIDFIHDIEIANRD